MGKSWKHRRHASTGYPYSHMRLAQVHIVRPKVRSEESNSFFLGLFVDSPAAQLSANQGLLLTKADQSLELKRLEFIRSYSTYYSSKVAGLYARSRSKLPRALQPRLDAVESRVTAVSMPVVQAMQIRSEQLLTSLDRKVDDACVLANNWLWSKPALSHQQNKKHTMRFKDSMAVQAGSPTVAKLLERAQPSLDYAAMKYMDAHNSIVASHAYCHALQSISVLLVQMQDSALFRAVYPVISPVADPTWETISHSTYYEALLQHLKPMHGQPPPGQLPAGPAVG